MARRLLVGLLSALLLVSAAACGSEGGAPAPGTTRDDRAYPVDSGELTLDTGLARAGIQVPDCLADDLRYALINDGFNYYYRVYLGLRTSEDCMNQFLERNGVSHYVTKARQVESREWEKPLKYRPLWMDNEVVRQLGWRIGADEPLLTYGARTGTDYTVELYLQHVAGTPDVLGYLYAFHGG
jgi:hypothetical protein